MPPKPETVAAIKADEFATKSLNAIRDLIYFIHRDWNTTTWDGKIAFDDDKWGVCYLALSALLETTEEPEVEGKVMVGGTMANASVIAQLTKALRR